MNAFTVFALEEAGQNDLPAPTIVVSFLLEASK